MFVFRSVPTITLNCTQRSSLPGCLVEFDHLEQQCAEGRIGKWDCVCLSVCLSVCASLLLQVSPGTLYRANVCCV